MSPQQAIARWQHAQAQTLKASYQQAWRQGQQNYAARRATPPATATAIPPVKPAATPMGRALTPALISLAAMGAGLAAAIAAAAGALAAKAAVEYLEHNAWRLAAAVSLIWAGEQHGFAQTAAADGLLLAWELEPGAEHCADCVALAALPPMALEQWPTLPGEGATACNVGCRCTLEAIAAPVPVLSVAEQELLAHIAGEQPALIAA